MVLATRFWSRLLFDYQVCDLSGTAATKRVFNPCLRNTNTPFLCEQRIQQPNDPFARITFRGYAFANAAKFTPGKQLSVYEKLENVAITPKTGRRQLQVLWNTSVLKLPYRVYCAVLCLSIPEFIKLSSTASTTAMPFATA